jgi:hypothetical protein
MSENKFSQNTETDKTTLGAIAKGVGGSELTWLKVLINNNLGHTTLLMSLSLKKFCELSLVANDRSKMEPNEIAQRQLDPVHARKLAKYILKGLVAAAIQEKKDKSESVPESWQAIYSELGPQPYTAIQPLVVNIRNCKPDGKDLKVRDQGSCNYLVGLPQGQKLYVIDGQHRRKGLEEMYDFLKTVIDKAVYTKRGLYCPADRTIDNGSYQMSGEELELWNQCYLLTENAASVAVEVHLGLDIEAERQLFHDLNRLSKKVDTNLALFFDSSNPITEYSKEYLEESELIAITDDAKDSDWDRDEGKLLRKDVMAVNARLFLNSNNISKATPASVTEGKDVANHFWNAVASIPGFGKPGAKKATVAAQPVVLKALAKLAFDFTLSNRRPENGEELFEKLLKGIDQTSEKPINFKHDNPVWRYYELTQEEREKFGLQKLENYLPSEESGNRDIGAYSDGYFRFGAKHNDIFPIIGDMIRWQLGLPARTKK